MTRLYFDTETTGFPKPFGTPIDECPYIVQIAALLVDDDEGEIASINQIIQPNDFEIPAQASEIHGITTAKATRYGIPSRVAMATFSQMARRADQIVAHNIKFDLQLVAYELSRHSAPNIINAIPRFCTMEATIPLCKLPGNRPGQYKWPKLMEAHIILLGNSFESAHDALADVRACQRIHAHLIQNQHCK
jgi:DNA polymerase III epsilon subunit-like protein